MALFGQRQGIPIAAVGPDKTKPLVEATRHLIELGHQRIVLLTREMRRLPSPGVPEQAFLDELANHNLLSGSYNLPDWEDTIDGYQEVLDSLFSVTPPTAILTCLPNQFIATILNLSLKGIKIPTDVSLMCLDDEEAMDWCRPSVAHIRWEAQPVINRILRWVDNISLGKEDLRQTLTPAEYIQGGTIGPAQGYSISQK